MLSTSLVPLALLATLAAASNPLDRRQSRVYSNPVQPTAITGDPPTISLTIITPSTNIIPSTALPPGATGGDPIASDSTTVPEPTMPTTTETIITDMSTAMPTNVPTDTTSMSMPVSSEAPVTSATGGQTETGTGTGTGSSTPTPTFNPATKPSAFANPAVAGVIALAGLAIAL